jgi:hypothetical protein
MKDLKINLNVNIKLLDENGNLKDERNSHNDTTNAGKYAIADQLLTSPTLSKTTFIAIGTGTPGATLLGTEVARVSASKLRTNAVVTLSATVPAGTGTGSITEAGIFDVVTANTVNMWAYDTFTAVNKTATDALVISWTITIA